MEKLASGSEKGCSEVKRIASFAAARVPGGQYIKEFTHSNLKGLIDLRFRKEMFSIAQACKKLKE